MMEKYLKRTDILKTDINCVTRAWSKLIMNNKCICKRGKDAEFWTVISETDDVICSFGKITVLRCHKKILVSLFLIHKVKTIHKFIYHKVPVIRVLIG